MKTKLNGILTLFLALVVQIAFAQDRTISGTVTDQDGLPLPGVNILVKGTTSGTQTDFDGNFVIMGSTGQSLLFTYIGQKKCYSDHWSRKHY
ncbi:TonB-dependent receptor P3 [Arenibacter antarcticus]|uniref:Carboxypeptidase-like regulatory domain-containing protein n=1 Tax=Arenibacter antarcticus TaxID=2040469 RepID=A0ABW5VE42_9FLAO